MALPNNGRPYFILIALGLMFSILGASEMYGRAEIEAVGRIASAETHCQEPQHNRCVTSYAITGEDGTTTTYSAGPTDKSLSRHLPIGSFVEKYKWHLLYRVDGKERNDFPLAFYAGLLGGGMGAFLWGLYLRRKWPV